MGRVISTAPAAVNLGGTIRSAAGTMSFDMPTVRIEAFVGAELDLNLLRPYLLNWLRKMGAEANRLFRQTTAGWSTPKPRFYAVQPKFSRAEGQMQVTVGTDNQRYAWVDRGTKLYPIRTYGGRVRGMSAMDATRHMYRMMTDAGRPTKSMWETVETPMGEGDRRFTRKTQRLRSTEPTGPERLAFQVPYGARTKPGSMSSGKRSGGSQGNISPRRRKGFNPGLRRPHAVSANHRSYTGYGEAGYHIAPRRFTETVRDLMEARMQEDFPRALQEALEKSVVRKDARAGGTR